MFIFVLFIVQWICELFWNDCANNGKSAKPGTNEADTILINYRMGEGGEGGHFETCIFLAEY